MKYLYFLITVLFLNAFAVQAQNTYVPDDGFEAILIGLGYDTGALDDYVLTANIAGVTSLSIHNFNGFDPDVNDFTGIEDFASLTSFTANFVSAPSIDLSNNTALTSVSVLGGYLTDVNLKNGNNTLLTNLNIFSFNGGGSTISPVRICIDDINYANANLQDIYATGNYFVENCTTNVNSITGTTYFDADNSGTCDPSEVVSSGGYLTSTGSGAGNYIFTSYPFLENYATYSLDPNVTISLGGIPPYFNVTAVPIAPATSETFVYTNTGNQDVVDYCITANSTVNDLQVETYVVTASKPGFQTRVRIQYKNTGTTTLSGAVSLNYDGLREVFNTAFDVPSDGTSSTPFPPTTMATNTLSWDYFNIAPFETRSIDVFFTLNTPTDPVNPLVGGDMMTYNAAITPIAGDATPANNGHSFIDPIVNAYDPNDVTCFEGDKISLAQVPDDLTYRIRFQNTGNAAATNILVNNAIDSDLDISTFQFIGASDPVTITTTGPNEIKFTFLNINLPDSTSDEPNSHGWILYKMKPQSTAIIGDIFENTASIYFDYNAPIITNTATTTVAATTYVPDDNFEQALIDLGYDSGPLDDYVFTCNIDTVTFLSVHNKNISDLTGLDGFTSLTLLLCYSNQLTAIDLSSNTQLTDLVAHGNQITSLDLSSNTALQHLNFNGNQLSILDLSSTPNIAYVYADSNMLTLLDVSQNGSLERLWVANNQLTSLNVKNGNNTAFTDTYFKTSNNPGLLCIEVDDAAYSDANWLNVDAVSSFSENCNPVIQAPCAYTQIAAGGAHTLAIKSDGTLWVWGNNEFGQLGDGTNLNKSIPTQIGTSTNWNTIAAGNSSSIATQSDGTLWAWGNNGYGQLGDGTTVGKNTPTQIGAGNNWIDVCAGLFHSLAKQSDGSLWAWGFNQAGQLGDGTTVNKTSPVQIGADTDWNIISTKWGHTIATKVDGTLWTWGNNLDGQLGDGTTINKTSPIQIGAASNWKSIAAGQSHSLATKMDNTLWTWGDNQVGQLGDGTTVNKTTPTQLGTETNWNMISGGIKNTLATKIDGSLWAWGDNTDGQLGDGTTVNKTSPTQIGTGTDWDSITSSNGFSFSLATQTDGSILAWGRNSHGQLGDGTNVNKNVPTAVFCAVSPLALTHVPDDNFETYLETHDANGNVVALGDPTSMGNGIALDDYVFTSAINTVIGLNVASQGISDLTGIEDFAALQNLTATSNNLTTVNITQNTQLLTVNFLFNSLTALDVSQNLNLVTLITHHNNLTSLDISNNLQLTGLDCRVNNISALDISNPLLAWVHTSDNGMTTLTTGANTALGTLYCHNNALTNLDFSANTSLSLLYTDNNQLTSLNVKNGNNMNVTQFQSQNNPNLLCIEVDDTAYSGANWFSIDPASSFSTDCSLLDTDLDGITDSDEANIHNTDPNDADTDDDGLSDGDEINIYSTNPLTADSDGDGLFDGTEVGVTAPLADTDVSAGAFIADADAGVTTTDPNNDDTDGDNLLDGQEDANQNGSTDNPVIGGTGTVGSGETDPNMADSDLDGVSDGDEVLLHGSNPLDTDSDDGGADDGTEINIDSTDPLQPADDDADGDGFSIADGDCDDTNAAINPGATEICDGIDNNCDGTIDESGDLFYVDADGDGFGDDNLPQVSGCGLTIGYSTINGDCDDADPLVNPAATEICDGIDNNCDGTIDESGDLFYVDADGDGFGDDNVPLVPGCGLASNGYSTVGGDCDDSNATVYPGAPEVFDGVDNNCNGQVDEALTYVPDDNFEQRLITLGYDTGALDDYVPTANINTVISLDVASQGIADLTGIEDFAALQNLTATSNNLTTVDITQNAQLLTVNFLFNSLTALDVSQNLNLVTLITHHNNLTSLDISNNLQLTGLDCRVNNISALDISNPLLAWVHTSDNGMTSLTTGANTALSSLYCHNNSLTNLDFSANTSLNLLYADNNQLTSLNIKNGNNLNVVEFRAQTNSNLLCIEVDDASYSSANWFNIDPVSSFGTDCSDADGDGYFAFEDCDDNDPLVNPGAVEVFDGIDNNCNGEIDEDLTYVPDDNFETYLETHDASGAVVALGDPTSMGNGIALDDYVTTSHINTVTSLNVNSLNIADLTGIADFSALINLTCQYNQLTTIGVSTLTSLTTLYCNNNLIVSLDVSPNAALTEFACHSNLLADLNVQNGNNINFTHFSAINNPDLTCIFVDDATYSTANWINIDSTATFVNDQAGCDALGVNDFTLPALTLYPNPASSTVQIEGLITTAAYTLYNAIGVQVSRGEVVNNEQIDINSLASGLYFLKLDSGNILKFVKE